MRAARLGGGPVDNFCPNFGLPPSLLLFRIIFKLEILKFIIQGATLRSPFGAERSPAKDFKPSHYRPADLFRDSD
uniref:Uncharacterized protein n=1 Tax=Candidatus Kentrum eta TaxID=2126337 RepID=A0A450VI83_9GAMM|nr:MAG: hypothetical protein BECKH772B_GA0070898_104471 [Candidatus Kentron sp. H]VFK05483.1 MAG: hypothetical protein BECKH772A_GA0070896_105591 [Candidatus Kentron sp. H]VFK07732.1 MAG: hypothetical protein BECKH772C_GA0070978_104501 [Candidatus Kentron sp. H]